MSDSANPSPTGLLSPSDEVAGNGFTAVNPPQKSGRMAERDLSRASQDPRNHRFESTEMRRDATGSPMNSAKRKRSSVGSNEESDESASNDGSPEGDSLQSVRNYPGPPPPPPTGDPRDRAWNNNNGHGRPLEAEESRLAEALQRENQGGHGLNTHNGVMEDDRGMGRSYHYNEHNGIITTNAGVQMDPKKRKRAFTNRNNCQRGGFVCEGYMAKSNWPKQNNVTKQLPTPIQSRVLYGENQGNLYPRQPRTEYMDPSVPMHPSMRGRMDEDSPDRPGNGWTNAYGGLAHRPYDRDPHSIPVPVTLQVRDSYDRPLSASNHGINSMHSHGIHQAQSPLTQGHQALAQRALNIPPHDGRISQPIGYHGKTDKEKMLSGELYMPYSRDLQQERERCKEALHSYNNLGKPNINAEERSRDFRNLLEAPQIGQQATRIAQGVYVDPPFRCDYGYNIYIGKDVAIESGCFISDPREVMIGDETFIGPNVTIMGKIHPYDLESRKGGALNGKARGIKIIIGKRVHIGAGCVISPSEEHVQDGVLEIGDGAFINPGSTVVKNVPPAKIFGQKYAELMDVTKDVPTARSPDKDRHFS
ncbi:GTP-binding protein [Venturia nashicola]|uniref:GTP-binding protein n=1 Tax=Venturia nashicola TaxID=86259 RepID=A0A4Z1P1V7_9PEZI|nr:GTP-binding protein [Venturia nashicola]